METKQTKKLLEVSDAMARRLKRYARLKRREKLLKAVLEKERDAILESIGLEPKILTYGEQQLGNVLSIDKTYVDSKLLKENFAEVYGRVTRNQTETQLRT